jgi:NAD(P)-dependent dehydrogenase (short-subunit alcohol dehydrogenase family)
VAGGERLGVAIIDAVIDVHLKGGFYVSQPGFRITREQGYGRIVNTTSASGLFGNFGQANYGAAKAGLAGLNRVLATRVPAAAPRSMPSPRSPRPA